MRPLEKLFRDNKHVLIHVCGEAGTKGCTSMRPLRNGFMEVDILCYNHELERRTKCILTVHRSAICIIEVEADSSSDPEMLAEFKRVLVGEE